MRVNLPALPGRAVALSVLSLLVLLAVSGLWKVQAQRGSALTMAQVGAANPLPVFVVNNADLPENFIPGSTWKFTTWTVPNNLSFTATIEKTEGGWALLKTNLDSISRWYYVPQMPGAWTPQ